MSAATILLALNHFLSSDQASINCTEVNEEYNNERVRCKELFNPCITQSSLCASVSKFCSDECRSIYQKVLWCSNSTISSFHLDYLSLLCASASDPRYENRKCLDYTVSKDTEYVGYVSVCAIEIETSLGFPCTESCNNSLMAFQDDCCSVNIALVWRLSSVGPGQNISDVISLYSNRLWEHCEVDSPRMCPTPACPTAPASPTQITMTLLPTTDVGATPPPDTGAAAKHRMNWFVLFIMVVILCI